MHPHTNCPSCKEASDAHHAAFVKDCAKIFRGSFAELYDKLLKRGYKILKLEAHK